MVRGCAQRTDHTHCRQPRPERWYLWLEEAEAGNLGVIYNLMSKDWDQYGDYPPEEKLKEILEIGYKIMPETIKEIFKGLHESGERAMIKEWVPKTYKPKKLF